MVLPIILLCVIGHDRYFTVVSKTVTTVQGAKNKETFYFSMYVYMVCVHTHTFVGSCVWGGCLCVNVHVCGSLGLMFRVSPHLICEVGLSLKPALSFPVVWLASLIWGSMTLPPRSGTGVTHMFVHLAIPRVQDSNSGPHNCMGRALSAKTCPSPKILLITINACFSGQPLQVLQPL